MGSRGYRKFSLARQAQEEAMEAEILEEYWDRSLGKEEHSEELTFGAVAQEHKAENHIWGLSFYHY